jgi:hypothetical protein
MASRIVAPHGSGRSLTKELIVRYAQADIGDAEAQSLILQPLSPGSRASVPFTRTVDTSAGADAMFYLAVITEIRIAQLQIYLEPR